jgi:GNAT superfamily N-acetyltransferase
MQVRKGTRLDAPACLEIAGSLPEYFIQSGLETLREEIACQDIYAACEGERVEAFLLIKMKCGSMAEVTWMAVRKDRQGLGLGSAFLGSVMETLKDSGVRLLEVKTLSPAADYGPYARTRKFYQGMGFLLLEELMHHPQWGAQSPCAIYVKIL